MLQLESFAIIQVLCNVANLQVHQLLKSIAIMDLMLQMVSTYKARDICYNFLCCKWYLFDVGIPLMYAMVSIYNANKNSNQNDRNNSYSKHCIHSKCQQILKSK